jgi:hypothetical protein
LGNQLARDPRNGPRGEIMRIKLLASIVGLLALTCFAADARAAGGTGQITALTICNGVSYAMVGFTGLVDTSRPTCHSTLSTYASSFAFDISTDKGKAMLSLLEGAQLAGKTVGYGDGSATCVTVQPGVSIETLSIVGVYSN